jgi:hypothetical protein
MQDFKYFLLHLYKIHALQMEPTPLYKIHVLQMEPTPFVPE